MTNARWSPLVLIEDVRTCIGFLTRVPVSAISKHGNLARASWAFPLAGLVVGAIGALVLWLAHKAGLPALVAATLAVAVTVLATGCLHEDGLADTADGFGGGATRERKLEIMRDSSIGAFGACAVGLSLILRIVALASIADVAAAAWVLLASHVAARAVLPMTMRLVPRARAEGLSFAAGRPSGVSAAVAASLGVVALSAGLGAERAVVALLAVVVISVVMAWACRRQIGGQTGDTLGALEQATEIAVLLVAAAR
ncbi:MAG: adenosylcobinamide-GDP ribazoletransferase [Pseudolabrys sp.]